MHATKQPSYPKGDYRAGIGLCFDRAAQYFLVPSCCVCCLPVKVLSGSSRLIGQTFTLCMRVARDLAEALLNLSSYVAGGAFYAVLIHDRLLHSAVNLAQSNKVRPVEHA